MRVSGFCQFVWIIKKSIISFQRILRGLLKFFSGVYETRLPSGLYWIQSLAELGIKIIVYMDRLIVVPSCHLKEDLK